MKRKYLEEVIHKHGRRIKKYGEQLPGHFDAEAIHELRLEYKKLRAFVRMVQQDDDTSRHFAIPSSFKNLYRAAGDVRDLQLFLPEVMIRAAKDNTTLPVVLQYLEHRLFKAKEELVKAIEEAEVDSELDKLEKGLPKYLQDATIRRFMHQKIAAIQVLLLALESDKDLHSIRKHLKDIIYNIRIFDKDWGLSFPVTAWRSEKRLEETAELLGQFNDQCIALDFLEEIMEADLPGEEKYFIARWHAELLTEKETLKQQAIEQVHHLQLVSNFEQLA